LFKQITSNLVWYYCHVLSFW